MPLTAKGTTGYSASRMPSRAVAFAFALECLRGKLADLIFRWSTPTGPEMSCPLRGLRNKERGRETYREARVS
jgi:hypothetical protein